MKSTRELMHNAINNMWPRHTATADGAAAANAVGSLLPGAIWQTANPSQVPAVDKPKDQPLFSARIAVVRAANGYLLTISTEARYEATTYIAKDLPEVMDLLRAAMAAVQLEDK